MKKLKNWLANGGFLPLGLVLGIMLLIIVVNSGVVQERGIQDDGGFQIARLYTNGNIVITGFNSHKVLGRKGARLVCTTSTFYRGVPPHITERPASPEEALLFEEMHRSN